MHQLPACKASAETLTRQRAVDLSNQQCCSSGPAAVQGFVRCNCNKLPQSVRAAAPPMHDTRFCLRRASDFIVALLHRLHDDQQVSLSTAASDAYYKTLYNNHTWYTSAAFVVVLKVSL